MSHSCDHDHSPRGAGELNIQYHENWQAGSNKGNTVCFLPTECGVPRKLHALWNSNGKRPYVVSAPEAVLKDPQMMLKVLSDLAKVAHASEVQIFLDRSTKYFSEEGPSSVRDLGIALSTRRDIGTLVRVVDFDEEESVFDEISGDFRVRLAALCMDQRVTRGLPDFLSRQDEESSEKMRNVGMPWVEKRYARLRHFASILAWHPKALEVLPPEHREYILKSIEGIRAHTRWQFKSIGNHFSTNGADGCAGVAYLRNLGMEITDASHEVELFKELQGHYSDILGDAIIKFDIVSGTGKKMKVERVQLAELDFGRNKKLVGNNFITA